MFHFIGRDLVFHVVFAPDQGIDLAFDERGLLAGDNRADDFIKRTVPHEKGRHHTGRCDVGIE